MEGLSPEGEQTTVLRVWINDWPFVSVPFSTEATESLPTFPESHHDSSSAHTPRVAHIF